MKISKYHGCENSFLITLYNPYVDFSKLSKKLCAKEKHDADGLLVLKNDPIEMVIYNKDGSEANMCGNGIRCMMHYCFDKFQIYKYLKIKTRAGYFKCVVEEEKPFYASVNLGIPSYPKNIIHKPIIVLDRVFEITTVLLGVLHTIVFVDDFDSNLSYADGISNHSLFCNQTNVDFVRVVDKKTLEVMSFERGVGWTKSCGTGAAAAAYVSHEEKKVSSSVNVITAGGILKVKIEDAVYLYGPSEYVEEFEEEV